MRQQELSAKPGASKQEAATAIVDSIAELIFIS
jgi:hypothetical protein